MAEEKKAEAKKDEKPADAGHAAPAADAGGGKGPLIVALACLVIMPIASFGIAYFVLKPAPAKTEAKAGAEGDAHGDAPKEGADAGHGEKAEEKGGHGEEKKEEKGHGEEGKGEEGKDSGKKAIGREQINTFETVVNVAGTRGTRFLRAGMYLKVPKKVLPELEDPEMHARVLSIIQGILRSKRLDELEDPGISQRLRNEIIISINPILKKGSQIEDVYFTDLVIQ